MEEDWQNSLTSLKERNLHLLRTGLRADCRFLVGVEAESQEIIKAHTFMLCKASPVFETMFYGSIPENCEKAIVIDDIEAEDFKDLLEFIYTDEIMIKSVAKAQKIYHAANKYMVKQLRQRCIIYLEWKLNVKNVCEIFEFAKRFEEHNLEQLCLKIIVKKTSDVLASETFYLANLTTLEMIVSQEKLQISNELELFNALDRYAKHRYFRDQLSDENDEDESFTMEPKAKIMKRNPRLITESCNIKGNYEQQANDFDNFLKLVKKIRFLLITAEQFASSVAFSRLLTKADALAILACIVQPQNVYKNFPSGFSNLKINRRCWTYEFNK